MNTNNVGNRNRTFRITIIFAWQSLSQLQWLTSIVDSWVIMTVRWNFLSLSLRCSDQEDQPPPHAELRDPVLLSNIYLQIKLILTGLLEGKAAPTLAGIYIAAKKRRFSG
jgi:hypothetical protein